MSPIRVCERAAVQLVERMRADAHAEEEREESREPSTPGRHCGASAAPIATYDRCHSVYGGCSKRHVVAPPAGRERVEGGSTSPRVTRGGPR